MPAGSSGPNGVNPSVFGADFSRCPQKIRAQGLRSAQFQRELRPVLLEHGIFELLKAPAVGRQAAQHRIPVGGCHRYPQLRIPSTHTTGVGKATGRQHHGQLPDLRIPFIAHGPQQCSTHQHRHVGNQSHSLVVLGRGGRQPMTTHADGQITNLGQGGGVCRRIRSRDPRAAAEQIQHTGLNAA